MDNQISEKTRGIDFVIPWVDGSDPAWRAQKAQYSGNASGGADSAEMGSSDDRDIRYRDWELLRYWFRGVEKFAPWVDTVHFVTWGHLPEWLNTEHPRLHIVRHEDYIPGKYLPTFSSHPIELNLHRIPGLSDRFVYFNDDIFILKPLEESDFFQGGLPCDLCAANAITPRLGEFSPILLQDTSYINKHFNKKQDIRRNRSKWFSLKYGKLLVRTICLLPWTYHTGFYNPHLAMPYLKSTFEKVWEEEPEILDRSCSHRFRDDSDVNQYIFRYWRLCEGEFVPHAQLGRYVNMGDDNSRIYSMIKSRSCKLLCINDKENKSDFETEKRRLQEAFESVFPEKSGFER